MNAFRSMSLFCLIALSLVERNVAIVEAQAWQSNGETFTFPEMELEEVKSRPNVGIAFSGGGSRSFTAVMGEMAAFIDLGFLDSVRYITASSGGSWGTVVATYAQHDNVTDNVLFGEIVYPGELARENLLIMDPNCARGYTNYSDPNLDLTRFDGWEDAVQEIYFSPAGIHRGSAFSYNNVSVSEIISRNPFLSADTFQTLRGTFGNRTGINYRPYPIVQATLIGPDYLNPAKPQNRNYTMLEFTPLTAGVAYTSVLEYWALKHPHQKVAKVIGGLIEPFAFNSTGPTVGLPVGQSTGFLEVDATRPQLDWALASGASSWAAGAFLAASDAPTLQEGVGTLRYWAPSASNPRAEEDVYAVADGAGVSNTDFISLLQRNVSTIFAFVNTPTPLQNSTHWDPSTTPPTTDDIDFTVPAWFGVICTGLNEFDIYNNDLNGSQVFAPEDWVPFATALQAAQASGNGNVVTFLHTTAANGKYGLQAGKKVTVVWAYLGRALGWEAQLSDAMKELVVPKTDPYNQAVTIQSGPFRAFPCYATELANINYERANLLADFTGWMVKNNAAQYAAALAAVIVPSPPPTPNPSASTSKSSDKLSEAELIIIVCCSAFGFVLLLVGVFYYFVVVARSAMPPMAATDATAHMGGHADIEMNGN